MARVTDPGYHRGRVPANKGKRYPPEVLTPHEVGALLDACSPTSSIGLRARAMITVLCRAGLRASEALALYPKDIDAHIGSIAVLHGKGVRHRVVGIDPTALSIIQAWVSRRTELGLDSRSPLFCTLAGRPMDTAYFRTLLPRLAHAHGLRHTHAFELMMEGVPMRIIQQQLGHASLATTDRYLAHIAPREVIETMRARDWQA